MRRFIRLFCLDMRKGILAQWKRYIACFIIVFLLSVLASLYAQQHFIVNSGDYGLEFPMTFGEMYMSLFAGMSRNYFDEPFVLPFAWMLVVLAAAYLTLDYAVSDIEDAGINSISLSGSRTLWWLSKCCWVFVSVVLYFLTVGLAIALAVICVGGELSLNISADILSSLVIYASTITEGPWDIVPFILSSFVVVFALCMIQLCASLFVGPLPSFISIVVIVFLSAFFSHDLLLGEYLMLVRSNVMLADGYVPLFGAGLSAVLIVWSVLFSVLMFNKIDLCARSDS